MKSVPRPLGRLAGLPGFPDITVTAQDLGGGRCCFDYSGWPEDLVAAGVMQADWLTHTGKHLRDPDGGKVSISRRWRVVSPEVPPRRYCVVGRESPIAELARWPGALEALEAYRAYQEYYWGAMPQTAAPVKAARPKLVLVVDNTRKGPDD